MVMGITVKAVNDALASLGIDGKLVKGFGYYYFVGPAFDQHKNTSIHIRVLRRLSLKQWVKEATDILNRK
jgi:hypothetical protein